MIIDRHQRRCARATAITALFMICLLTTVFAAGEWKPNRVLVIIGDQWSDPTSQIIDGPNGEGPVVSYVKESTVAARSGEPFWRLTALLKVLGIPFDILRLDQADLNINYFLDHHNRPAYGTIVWDVDQEVVPPRNYAVLSRAVKDYGISLIALYDGIKEPVIRELLGIDWNLEYYHSDDAPLRITEEHFITRGFTGSESPPPGGNDSGYKALVTPTTARVLATQGDGPAVTVRDVSGETKTVWIGGKANYALTGYPVLTKLLRRSLVYGIGYSLYKTFPKTVMFSMDDPSATTMYELWHFPALDEEQIVEGVLKPLKERDAVLAVNMTPGRVVDDSRMVEPNWTQVYSDELGEKQDMVSNGRGWQLAIEAGVVEVQSHGWTHMHPNLDLYWSNHLSRRLHPHWGSEFFDRMRGVEIPGSVQLIHMKKSIEGLTAHWNKRPLYLVAGQNADSYSFPNHTARLARTAGFAMYLDFWLGGEFIINLNEYLYQPRRGGENFALDGERPIWIGCHDFDVYKDPGYIKKRLDRFGPEYRFTGRNEIIGYTWAEVSGGPGGTIVFEYNPVFCQYFKENGSNWSLHLSDRLLGELREEGRLEIVTDGQSRRVDAKRYLQEVTEITIPAGVGRHVVEFR
jgi:hypothetical protein